MAEGLETLPAAEPADPTAPPVSTPAVPAPNVRSPLRSVLLALRPKQWAKNVLIFAAPGAAGVLSHGHSLGRAAVAFGAFCLLSSGTYLLNDVRDLEADRRHPTKRHRPIAAGEVGQGIALALGLVLIAAALAIGALLRLEFLVVLLVYVGITAAYTLSLKHEPILDIVAIASGFIVRAVAGGVAVDVPLSRWFLIVTSFGSLFMVSGKRHGEHIDLGDDRADVRSTLGVYSRNYLQYVWTMTSGVTVAAYCLWAFAMAPKNAAVPLYELSIVPFVTFILRYAMLLEQGRGESPEDLVLGDRMLLALAVVWIAVFGSGVYFLH